MENEIIITKIRNGFLIRETVPRHANPADLTTPVVGFDVEQTYYRDLDEIRLSVHFEE